MHVNNTNEKRYFRQSLLYCELHSRNTQPCLSFGVRKYPELVKPESLCIILLLLICRAGTRQHPCNTRIFLTFITLNLSLSFLYKCSSNTVFPFSGKWSQFFYQPAPQHASMRSHRLIHGTVSAASVCWPHKSAKSLLILSLQLPIHF